MARPDLGETIGALLSDLGVAVPEAFGPVDVRRVLVVAGAARRDARASVRALGPLASTEGRWDIPEVSIDGAAILYEITLRPLFFRACTAEARVVTLAHELWHAGPAFDGTLAPSRRHAVARGDPVEAEVTAAVRAWRARSTRAERLTQALSATGEYVMWAWLRRPPSRIPRSSGLRRRYFVTDLYSSIVELR